MLRKITLDDLARMVKVGFDETAKKVDMDKRFEQVDKRFEQVDKRFDRLETRMDRFETRLAHIDARITVIERDIAEIRKELIPRMEIEDIMARLSLVERKLGIKSGK